MDELNNSISELNQEEAKQYIGGVVFISIIMTLGIVGNLHVLFLYAFRIKPSNHRTFILLLGALDSTTCVIGMPLNIFYLRNPLTFTMSSACKLFRLVNHFTSSASVFTLVVIAVDRYRKICVPFGRQISRKLAKVVCFLVILIAVIISWPAPVLYGSSIVKTANPNISGARCYTEDKENFAKYQAYFNSLLILIVLVSFNVLSVLYLKIWRTIVKHSGPKQSVTYKTSKVPTSSLSNNTKDSKVQELGGLYKHEKVYVVERHNEIRSCENDKEICKVEKTQNKESQTTDRSRKTTFMFLTITIVFFLSYVPHLTLKIIPFLNKQFNPQLSFTEKVVYNTFVWCSFINSMADCFIYGFFDLRFRIELKKMYKK